jgi:class 3 adenylate cyclase
VPGTATVTVLVTDLVGSTELLRHGPEVYDDLRRAHFDAVRSAIAEQRGVEVKSTGDGILATFTSASDAIAAATALQVGVTELQARDARQPDVRVGVSCGEATSEEGDWYGRPVIEAARLCAAAMGGQILASTVLEVIVAGRGGHRFIPRGELALKGFDQPMAVCEIGWTAPDRRTPLPPGAASALTGALVGRGDELAILVGAWKQVGAGHCRAVLVSGEPGIGKTRLLAELARYAQEEGSIVLWGRCDEDLAVPLQPLAEALRQWLPSADETVVENVKQGPLGRLLPGLDERRDLNRVAVASPSNDRELLLVAFDALVRQMGERGPVVLVIDDLQWATPPTLQVVRHLVREPSPMPLLVVATFRDTGLDRMHPLAGLLADLRRETNATRLVLNGLTEPSVAALLELTAGHDLDEAERHLAAAIYKQTEGNPFFVSQVLQHLSETGRLRELDQQSTASQPLDDTGVPEGVREIIGQRLSLLSDDANVALAVAAVVGHEFELATVQHVVDRGDCLNAIEEAISARLVGEIAGRPGRFVFEHTLVRQTLLADLTVARRARLHRRTGDALAAQPDADPTVCAHHFLEGATSGSARDAAEWTMRALEARAQHLSPHEAATLAERAMRVLDQGAEPFHAERAGILSRKSFLLQLQGDIETAKQVADEAIAEARLAGDPRRLAEAAVRRATWGSAGVPDAAAGAALDEALAAVGDVDPSARVQLLSTRGLWRAVNQGDGVGGRDDARDAAKLAWESTDGDTLVGANITRAVITQGDPNLDVQEEIFADIIRAVKLLPENAQRDRNVDVARVGFVLALRLGDRARAEDYIELAEGSGERTIRPRPSTLPRRRAVQSGDAHSTLANGFIAMWRATLALVDGRFDDAEAEAPFVAANNDVNFQNSWAALVFQIAHERGNAADLLTLIEAAVAATPGLVSLRAVQAQAYVEAHRLDAAASILAELAADQFAVLPMDITYSAALSQLADVAGTVGNEAAAAGLYERLLPFAGQMVVVAWGVFAPGAVDRYLGICASVCRRDAEADTRFKAGLDLEESIGGVALAARTRWWWSRSLAARGHSEQAIELVESACSTAGRLGMASLLTACDELCSSLA